jgi:hypothetical protein
MGAAARPAGCGSVTASGGRAVHAAIPSPRNEAGDSIHYRRAQAADGAHLDWRALRRCCLLCLRGCGGFLVPTKTASVFRGESSQERFESWPRCSPMKASIVSGRIGRRFSWCRALWSARTAAHLIVAMLKAGRLSWRNWRGERLAAPDRAHDAALRAYLLCNPLMLPLPGASD